MISLSLVVSDLSIAVIKSSVAINSNNAQNNPRAFMCA
jgi:hypothetical protein